MLPPGPRAPAAVQLLRWVYRPLELMDDCARRFGPWFTLRFPRGIVVMTSSPEATKEIFAAEPERLLAGRTLAFWKPLMGEHSLFLLDGDAHRRARKLMAPPFQGECVYAHGAAIEAIARRHLAAWPLGRPFPLYASFQAMTLDVILETIFGVAEGERLGRLRLLLPRLMDSIAGGNAFLSFLLGENGVPPGAALQAALGRLTPWGRFLSLRAELDRLLLAEIAERRRAPGGRDVLSQLLAAGGPAEGGLSDAELRDQLLTLLLAGHETGTAALCWVFSRLAGTPAVRERLEAELAGFAGADPGGPPYVEALINETLRLNPIVPFVWRGLPAPMRIAGVDLPAGVAVAPSIYLIHRSPGVWKDPEAFKPERFLDAKPAPWEFFPFGGGARRCLGGSFAMREMRVIVSCVSRALSLRVAPGYRAGVARRSIVLAPARGLPVTASRR